VKMFPPGILPRKMKKNRVEAVNLEG